MTAQQARQARIARRLQAAEAQTSASIVVMLKARVEKLLNMRVEIRKDWDRLHALYEDATGGYGGGTSSQAGDFPGHADPTVKEARDSLHALDNQIGDTYRLLENLERKIMKHVGGKKAETKTAAEVRMPSFGVNGSDPAKVAEDLADAGIALNQAIDRLDQCAPHGRDFSEVGFQEAKKSHADRMERLKSVYEEIAQLHAAIEDHIDEKARRKKSSTKTASFQSFFDAYVETALWSTTDESRDDGGDPLDDNYDASDIDAETLGKMKNDCRSFMQEQATLLQFIKSDEQAGHDFWLSRNGHGAGFFDLEPKDMIDGAPDDLPDGLQKAAKQWGEFYLHVGDDGKIYGSPL